MVDERAEPAERLLELSPKLRKVLAGLRDDEVDTLATLVELPPEEVRKAFEMVKAAQTVGRFARWIIVGGAGLFLGVVGLWEAINRFLELVRGAKP